MPVNQKQLIIEYLKCHSYLTVGIALAELGIYALSQRVGEINRDPLCETKIKVSRYKTDSGKLIGKYFI